MKNNIHKMGTYSPQAGYAVDWQNDGTQHGELTKNIVGLFCSFVHANVDLRKIIAVCA